MTRHIGPQPDGCAETHPKRVRGRPQPSRVLDREIASQGPQSHCGNRRRVHGGTTPPATAQRKKSAVCDVAQDSQALYECTVWRRRGEDPEESPQHKRLVEQPGCPRQPRGSSWTRPTPRLSQQQLFPRKKQLPPARRSWQAPQRDRWPAHQPPCPTQGHDSEEP